MYVCSTNGAFIGVNAVGVFVYCNLSMYISATRQVNYREGLGADVSLPGLVAIYICSGRAENDHMYEGEPKNAKGKREASSSKGIACLDMYLYVQTCSVF